MGITSIRVVDFAGDAEAGVSRRLVEELRTWAVTGRYSVDVFHHRIRSRIEFEQFILMTLESCLAKNEVPILHFEGHGDRDGIEIDRREQVPWHDFYEMLRVINIATRNHLLVTMATCQSAWSFLQVKLHRECPVGALIGPVENVSVAEVEGGFQAFYKALIHDGNLKGCLEALNSHVQSSTNEFAMLDAEDLFNSAVDDYMNKHCRGAIRRERLDNLVTRAVEDGIDAKMPLPVIRKHAKEHLWADPEPRMREWFNRFMMIDRYPENAARFTFNA